MGIERTEMVIWAIGCDECGLSRTAVNATETNARGCAVAMGMFPVDDGDSVKWICSRCAPKQKRVGE